MHTDEIIQRWTAAELAGDAAAMGELLADDFRAVGPRGFVLGRDAWIGRHTDGSLSYSRVAVQDTETRTAGPVEVTVGVQELTGRYEGPGGTHDLDETLRFTLVVADDRILSLQLSPIAPPPGAPGS